MANIGGFGGGFSFGKLWEEATRAVGYVVDGLVQGTQIASIERTKRDTAILAGRQLNASNINKSTLPIVVVSVVLLVAVGFSVFKKVKK